MSIMKCWMSIIEYELLNMKCWLSTLSDSGPLECPASEWWGSGADLRPMTKFCCVAAAARVFLVVQVQVNLSKEKEREISSFYTLRKLLRKAEPGGAGGDDESEYRRDQLACWWHESCAVHIGTTKRHLLFMFITWCIIPEYSFGPCNNYQ